MHTPRHDSYLESKVLTAPPQRLHLMLVEAAIRFGRQAADALRQGETTAAATPLLRVIDIVGELLVGVREQKSDLNLAIAGLYLYIFRSVSEAKINGDAAKLAEALQLLEYERETWQLLCEKLGAETYSAAARPARQAGDSAPAEATLFRQPQRDGHLANGFSLEA